ncbi:hypothetical protein ACSQ6I_00075 [Anabaena sp. WFMT]
MKSAVSDAKNLLIVTEFWSLTHQQKTLEIGVEKDVETFQEMSLQGL